VYEHCPGRHRRPLEFTVTALGVEGQIRGEGGVRIESNFAIERILSSRSSNGCRWEGGKVITAISAWSNIRRSEVKNPSSSKPHSAENFAAFSQ